MSRLFICLLSMGLLLTACSGGLKLNDRQKRGKKIYEGLCDKCHKLIPPSVHPDEIWRAAVPRYGVKLKLTSEEQNLILEYLTFANDTTRK